MGAIGPAIFSDDVACDVRDAYKQRVADGRTGGEATDSLIAEWLKGLREDDDDVLVFWLALAATQSKLGLLEDRVRDRAIAIIDSGEDLGRWREVGLEDKRQAALLKLREQLLGPQPAPKKVRVQRLYNPPCAAGDYVAFRLRSGRWMIWQILRVNDVNGIQCVAFDYLGEEIPDVSVLPTLPIKQMIGFPGAEQFGVATFKKRDLPGERFQVLPLNATPRRMSSGGVVHFWDGIDIGMKDDFGWE
jgi:hypothetical protein